MTYPNALRPKLRARARIPRLNEPTILISRTPGGNRRILIVLSARVARSILIAGTANASSVIKLFRMNKIFRGAIVSLIIKSTAKTNQINVEMSLISGESPCVNSMTVRISHMNARTSMVEGKADIATVAGSYEQQLEGIKARNWTLPSDAHQKLIT
jgi:hypothetical protein